MKQWSFITILFIIAVTSCTPASVSTETSTTIEPTSLRQLANERGFLIGTAVNVGDLRYDDMYIETLKREFNLLVPEGEMKFAFIHPAKDMYYFRDADYLVNFAQNADMKVRGHALLWYVQDPEWVQTGNFTKEELIEILRDHITTVVGRYKGQILTWDVVLEEINDDGSLRDNVWLRGIGPEYIDLAYQFAHEADPNALLFYDDNGEEGSGAKSDAIFSFVKSLRERNVPIDGVNLQMEVTLDDYPAPEDVRGNIERLSKLGLIVHAQLGVRLHQPVTESDLNAQGQIYKDVFEVCLSEKACRAFIMWGFTDKYSWIHDAYPGFGDAHIFDNAYKPKPAYDAIKEILSRKINNP